MSHSHVDIYILYMNIIIYPYFGKHTWWMQRGCLAPSWFCRCGRVPTQYFFQDAQAYSRVFKNSQKENWRSKGNYAQITPRHVFSWMLASGGYELRLLACLNLASLAWIEDVDEMIRLKAYTLLKYIFIFYFVFQKYCLVNFNCIMVPDLE